MLRKFKTFFNLKTFIYNLITWKSSHIFNAVNFVGGSSRRIPFQWILDYPSNKNGSKLLPNGLLVQGWVLLPSDMLGLQSQVRVVVRWEGMYEVIHPLEIKRPDVIKKILKYEGDLHPQVYCGFKFTIPARITSFDLDLVLNEKTWHMKQIRAKRDHVGYEAIKVIEGRQGWLFLDNDTNGSLDQYQGRMRLTNFGVESWKKYFNTIGEVINNQNCQWSILVAPAKETVMGPKYHIVKEGKERPIDQLLMLTEKANIVYPIQALSSLGDEAYIRTDSHWTQKGAMMATIELAVFFNIPRNKVENIFSKDIYVVRTMAGDLGSKFTPNRTCLVQALKSFNYKNHLVYDNGLPNFGRLLLIKFSQALIPATCLVFGSSSTNSMLNYLCRIFERVLFVHSAGSLDSSLLSAVSPDYIVFQSNARFLLQVPSLRFSLIDTIDQKLSALNDDQLNAIRGKLTDFQDLDLSIFGIDKWHHHLVMKLSESRISSD